MRDRGSDSRLRAKILESKIQGYHFKESDWVSFRFLEVHFNMRLHGDATAAFHVYVHVLKTKKHVTKKHLTEDVMLT